MITLHAIRARRSMSGFDWWEPTLVHSPPRTNAHIVLLVQLSYIERLSVEFKIRLSWNCYFHGGIEALEDWPLPDGLLGSISLRLLGCFIINLPRSTPKNWNCEKADIKYAFSLHIHPNLQHRIQKKRYWTGYCTRPAEGWRIAWPIREGEHDSGKGKKFWRGIFNHEEALCTVGAMIGWRIFTPTCRPHWRLVWLAPGI